jgi:uncharacterized repeat protein (TIGR03803 family)
MATTAEIAAGSSSNLLTATRAGSFPTFTASRDLPTDQTPIARPVFGPNHTLYGTTAAGGANFCEGPGCGTIYNLTPRTTPCTSILCYWSETVLASFGGEIAICGASSPVSRSVGQNSESGVCPSHGDLTIDAEGNIYGTTSCCYGAVYKVLPSGLLTVVYDFAGGNDGAYPDSGVVVDAAGNLYGTTSYGGGSGCGGMGCGVDYELSASGSNWTEKILYTFQGGSDGMMPLGGLIFDAAGNLYGTTSTGGTNGGGTVFELSPSGNQWNFQLLYGLAYTGGQYHIGPTGILAMDSIGNIYGTTAYDGTNGFGSVFKLTKSNGSWSYTSLHDFTGYQGADGAVPYGNVTFDTSGNL